jgi:hypothetical protein
VDGGEGDGEEAGVFDIVHADDADLFRDTDSESDEGLHEASGGEVVCADDGFRAGDVEEASDKGLVERTAAPNWITVRDNGKPAHSLMKAGDAGIDGSGGVGFTEKG